MAKKYNSIDKTSSDGVKNQQLVLEILTKIDQAINTSDSFVIVNSTDLNGNEITTQIPSISHINNRLEQLSNTIKKMSGFDGNPASILFDKNGKKIISYDINEEPEKINDLPTISTFVARPNWIFDSMMNPQICVELDLTNKIGDNTKTIISKRFVVEFDKMEYITQDGYRSEILTDNAELRLAEFNELYNNKSNIDLNSFVSWLERDGVTNKINEYLIDDDHFTIEPLNVQYKGNFNILSTEIDTINNKLWHIFESLEYLDMTYGYGNESILELKPGIELAVDNPSGTSATIYKVIEISTITSQYRVRLERIFGDDPVPIMNAALRIYSKPINQKKVRVSVGFDEYSVLFVKALNDLTHIQATEWSSGIGFYTNELRKDNATGTLLSDFYVNKVLDYGLILEELTEKKIPTYYGIQPNAPLLIQENFSVVQTNKHLTNTVDAERIRDLHNKRVMLESNLKQIHESIEKESAKISKTTFRTETEKKTAQQLVIKLNTDLINTTKTKNTITSEILLNSKNINKIKPTYAVRGIFPFPKAVMDPDGKTKPQEVVQFEIWYKKISKSGDENQLQTFKDITKKINLNKTADNLTANDIAKVNNTKNVNATFSNWIKYKTDARKQVFNAETGKYEWEIEDIEDANTPNINQIDISIEQGESIIIKVKSLSEVGYPEAPLESEFSNEITIAFPDNLASILNEDDFILKDATTDKAKSDILQELERLGLNKHLESQIRDVDVYYPHSAKDIASGFKDNNGKIINIYDYLLSLKNELIAVKESINRSKGILEIYMLMGNSRQRIYSASNETYNIQLENHMTNTKIGLASNPVSSITRTYKNEVIKISNYTLQLKNASETAVLGLLAQKGYGQPNGYVDNSLTYSGLASSTPTPTERTQIIYVNPSDEPLHSTVPTTSTPTGGPVPIIKTQSNNSFLWQYTKNMNGDSLITNVGLFYTNNGLPKMYFKNQAASSLSDDNVLKATTSKKYNIGVSGNIIASSSTTLPAMATESLGNDVNFTRYTELSNATSNTDTARTMATSIHACITDLNYLVDTSAQKIKYLAAGEDGNVNIPIVIYAKPFSSSENYITSIDLATGSDIKTSTSYLNNSIEVKIPITGSSGNITIISDPSNPSNNTINGDKLLAVLNSYSDINDVLECKLVITGVNTADANYNSQINGIPLKITNLVGTAGNITAVQISKPAPATVTTAPPPAVLSQVHLFNRNGSYVNNGGNGTTGLKCYNVYNTQNSYDSVVDSYIEIPNSSIPVEHSKTLRFALEDENNIRPYDFQFTWKITQHQRGTFRNTSTIIAPTQNVTTNQIFVI